MVIGAISFCVVVLERPPVPIHLVNVDQINMMRHDERRALAERGRGRRPGSA